MDRSAWALILSALALLLSLLHWALDWWSEGSLGRRRRSRHRRPVLEAEFLAEGTNCFVFRGGSTLVFVSFRVYNRSEQRAATVASVRAQLRSRRQWHDLEVYPTEHAAIFGSLVRNALPVNLKPGAYEDFYEVYQLPHLLDRTTARVRVRVVDYSGAEARAEDTITHRLDDRAPLDILFQTLEIRSADDYAQ
ncbi:MAG: hypothetical protein KatS3mg115_1331 [Candidatus Poribacteria bacterium]|nr:MAG: hypothetical protein KatS3mg115_1331 [Candidatus Poribacteria bacterium]